MKTLREVPIGDTVKVVKLHGEGAVKRRIMDMGITRGVEIYVRKVAPLGDPVEVNVRGYELSLRKAEAVSKNLSGETIVIGSDTVVYLDNEILGKPKDGADAYAMLEKLSGRTHIVYTGITVIFKSDSGEKAVSAVDATEVTFKKLAPGNISAYIASEEPFGKAGAYAVQGIGSIFIERINGDFFTVVGMSPKVLCGILESQGIDIMNLRK